MRSLIFVKQNIFKTHQELEHIIPTKLKALFAKISPKLAYALMEINVNSLMVLMNWDVTHNLTFHTRQSTVIHFWIKSVVFMDSDVTSFIKTTRQLINKKNGQKFTVIIVKLSKKVKHKIKVDWWPSCLSRLIDIYIE